MESDASDQAKRVERFLGRLIAQGWFGKVTVEIRDGQVVLIRAEQVLKIADL